MAGKAGSPPPQKIFRDNKKMNPAIFSLRIATVPASAAPDQEPPRLRLGDNVRPTRYALDLTLDPDLDDFPGTVDIDVQLRAPASVIWLNAAGLTIERATLRPGGQVLPGQPR